MPLQGTCVFGMVFPGRCPGDALGCRVVAPLARPGHEGLIEPRELVFYNVFGFMLWDLDEVPGLQLRWRVPDRRG